MSKQKLLPLTLHRDEIGEGKDWIDVTEEVMAAISNRAFRDVTEEEPEDEWLRRTR